MITLITTAALVAAIEPTTILVGATVPLVVTALGAVVPVSKVTPSMMFTQVEMTLMKAIVMSVPRMKSMDIKPTAQTSALALTINSPNPNAKKQTGKQKLDLTIQEGDEGDGLLQFFTCVSHKEYEGQTLVEFKRIAEKLEEMRVQRWVAAEKKGGEVLDVGL